MILIYLDREQQLALTQLRNSPNYQSFRELVEREKIKPIENQLLGDSGKPFSDIAEVRYLQGKREGLKAVFDYLDHLIKTKVERED